MEFDLKGAFGGVEKVVLDVRPLRSVCQEGGSHLAIIKVITQTISALSRDDVESVRDGQIRTLGILNRKIHLSPRGVLLPFLVA